MKKLLFVLLVTILSLSAWAQRRTAKQEGYRKSHVVVVNRPVFPYYPYYPYYHYGYYDPFYFSRFPYYWYEHSQRETKLDLQIADIRYDYQDKIWSARHNKKLSKEKRKEIIRRLKTQREVAINKAKAEYYKS